ncbi:endolytic transglycosylase MltG [Modestobacter sp. URMC 112]
MTGPADRRPGRHSSPDTDAGSGPSAAELRAGWAQDRSRRGSTAVTEQPARTAGRAPGADRRRRATDPPPAQTPADPSAVPAPRASELRTAEMRAVPITPPRVPSTRPGADRPTAGRPGARPAGSRPSAERPAAPERPLTGRSSIARPAPDRVSPAPWTTLDREVERFADDETAPGTSSGARRPLLGGRRTSDAAGATAVVTPAGASPLAAALAALDARHSADDERYDGHAAEQHDGRYDERYDGRYDERYDGRFDEHDGVGHDDLHDRYDDEPRDEHSGGPHDDHRDGPLDGHSDDWHDEHPVGVFDQTGGLELVVEDDDHHDDHHDLPPGGGRRRGRRDRGPRRRRRPLAIVLSLLVLAGLVGGIVVGGQALLRMVNPVAEDFTGAGTGSADVRINSGDSLRTIAAHLVEAGVIASTEPFLDAAEANSAAEGIQPGVYAMRTEMSGQAALDLLLQPATRQVTRVTVPEGQTVAQVLQRLAEETGTPLADLQAVAAAPAELGLPPYANGLLEGFLFPATYDVEPDTTPADMLRPMVARTVQVLDQLQIPVEQRLTVLTKASIVQAESGTVEQMGKVARVLENRLAEGMPLQLDTTVNYANGKSGITTTPEDRANPSPYNTYANPGLPPGAIDNPGEEALRAVLNPTPGPWRFFVVVDPDTGQTEFAETAEQHQQNVLVFQQWLRENPGG